MKLAVNHRTTYRYSGLVTESHDEIRLEPAPGPDLRVLSARLHLEPAGFVDKYVDYFGNRVTYQNVTTPHTCRVVESRLLVETSPARLNPEQSPPVPWSALTNLTLAGECGEMLLPGNLTRVPQPALLEPWQTEVRALPGYGEDAAVWSLALTQHLRKTLSYQPGTTTVNSRVDEVMRGRTGVCQDYAHLLALLCRLEGIPTRYVGGYQNQAGGNHQTHAWVEVYLPGLGWVGLDPANGIVAGEEHVRTTVGRDYGDQPPVRGIYVGPALLAMEVSLSLTSAGSGPVPERP